MTDFSLNLYRRSTHFTHAKKKAKYGLSKVAKDNSIKWTTYLNYSAAELDFDLIYPGKPVIPYTGDIISFTWDKHKLFYGFVFKYQVKEDNSVSVKCFGASRYLKNKDSIVFKTGTISDRFNEVCKRAGIKHKVISGSKHKVAAEVCDSKTYFDMVKSAIDKTETATDKHYFIYDNYQTVELRRVPYKKLDIYVGSKSGMTGFTYAVDIDQTYNIIRVVKKDSKKSQTVTATAKGKKTTKVATGDDPKNTSFSYADAKGQSVKQWGKLQTTVNAKDKANKAQMLQQAKDTLRQKNRANKTLTITCLGNINLIAGNAVTIKIIDLKKKISNCPIIKAVHTFGSDYKCELTMKSGESWQENGSTS